MHLRNVANGSKDCSPSLAAAIERESKGLVKRQTLFPAGVAARKKWRALWPELVEA